MILNLTSLATVDCGLWTGSPTFATVDCGLWTGSPILATVVLKPWDANWAAVPFGFWTCCFFALGCIVGSFLNVCIHRMPLGLSVVTPPSHCPHCKYSIPWYLNIPLVTWLTLRGRCKNCSAPISPRYFIVELLTGLTFLGCWLRFGSHDFPLPSIPLALVYAVFFAGLICATFIDIEHYIIPDEITLGGAVVGLIASLCLPKMHDTTSNLQSIGFSLLGVVVGAGIVYGILRLGKLLFGRHKLKLPAATKIFFTETALHFDGKEIGYEELFYRKSDVVVLHAQTVELVDRCYKDALVRLSPAALEIGGEKIDPDTVPCMECVTAEIVLPREAMGFGDVKFMGAIGAFIGWQGTIFSLAASSLIGATAGITLILMGRREWSSRMPYGPYIALAAAIWVLAHNSMFPWLH